MFADILLERSIYMLDFIIKLLDLKDEDIHYIDSISSFNDADFFIQLKVKDHICPHCGSFTHSIKDYKMRKISHKVLINFHSTIYYRQRRYICKNCGHSFIEYNPFSSSRYFLSPATVINILDDLKPYNSTFSSVARKYNVSVGTVIDIFDKHVQIPRKKLTEILCWDEFYFDRHSQKKYAFIMMDFKKKVILDILESRWNEDLYDYFFHIPIEERNQVHYIIIDMYANYRYLSQIFFQKAILCVDPFHVIKKVNDSLNDVRKRIMRYYSKDRDSLDYRLLKSRYHYILKKEDDLDNEKYFYDYILQYHTTEVGLAQRVIEINTELDIAYRIKEEYIALNDETEETFQGKAQKEKELNSLIRKIIISEIPEMIECAKTLKNWKKEILNSFKWFNGRRLSNGPIEGKNTYIKKIISNANGLKNFKRSRNKFLYSQNLYETYSITEHQIKIKMPGKKRGKYKKEKDDQQ